MEGTGLAWGQEKTRKGWKTASFSASISVSVLGPGGVNEPQSKWRGGNGHIQRMETRTRRN